MYSLSFDQENYKRVIRIIRFPNNILLVEVLRLHGQTKRVAPIVSRDLPSQILGDLVLSQETLEQVDGPVGTTLPTPRCWFFDVLLAEVEQRHCALGTRLLTYHLAPASQYVLAQKLNLRCCHSCHRSSQSGYRI